MSESKARLYVEKKTLKQEKDDLAWQLVRLLSYVHNMQLDYPDLDWPELPDNYTEMMWRYAA